MTSHGLETGVLSDVVLPLALAVIMFGMGMSLTVRDFGRLKERPRAVAAGLVGQLLLLPVLAIAVASVFYLLFDLPLPLVLGLLLLACVPGGATSNLLTYLARADTALSVTLTSISSLLAAVLTPLTFLAATALLFGDATPIEVRFAQMAALVLVIVAVPIAAGMAVRARRPALALRAEKPFRIASVLLLVAVVAGVIFENRADFWGLAARAVPAALALNVLALAGGFALGRMARAGPEAARAMSFEVGFQNGTLGIALAVTQLGSPEAAIVPGFYSLVMFVTGGALAWHWARNPRFEGVRRVAVVEPVGERS